MIYIFRPVRYALSPSMSSLVLIAPESEPAFVSVLAVQAILRPAIRSGRYRSRITFEEPRRMRKIVPSCDASESATLEELFENQPVIEHPQPAATGFRWESRSRDP